ncbi:hypothetical protein MVEN_01707200 [Mycena venus]|uniref:Uncharacterized protein n=1 Tax=Mycena venus TaxID=2733690 RepID=A0A8H6XMU9_9AGAR|nr:hypothetical protein MVEN_01707200 [Mycena venus]
MVQLISNFTAAATAATLLRILDIRKDHAFDVTEAGCTDLTPVQSYSAATVGNQAWALVGGPLSFQIVSFCNTFLTYPGAQTGAIALRSQATTHPVASSSWIISLVNPAIPTGPWNIIEEASNTYLTVWDQVVATQGQGTPITLEDGNPDDIRQQFWFIAA